MKTRILKILIFFLLIVLCAINVYATEEGTSNEGIDTNTIVGNAETDDTDDTDGETTEWTDFSNAKIVLTQEDDINYWQYTMKVTGVTLNENRTYSVFLTNGETQLVIPNSRDEFISESDGNLSTVEGEKNSVIGIQKSMCEFLEKNGDIYCWIIEGMTENGVFKTGTPYKSKIERPDMHSLGSRIKCYFFNNETSTFLFESNPYNADRKINVKIGTITDNNILLSIKNGESNCLQKLMDYAKSAESIYTGTVALGTSDSITSNINLIHDAYYYVYMEMEDENGKYYPIEDVSLYQALVSDVEGKNLFDYLSDNFKWNISEGNNSGTTAVDGDSTIAPTTKLPKAGVTIGVVMILGVLVINAGIGIHKYNKFKGIK